MKEIIFKEWKFVVDYSSTVSNYSQITSSGAESCVCNECKNYLECRDELFPKSILKLFQDLGIDYKKEVEVTYWEKLESGLYYIGGWFHFKGKILEGKRCLEPLPHNNGSILVLEKIDGKFSIGFDEGNSQTLFRNKSELIQVEFSTEIPWKISKELEAE